MDYQIILVRAVSLCGRLLAKRTQASPIVKEAKQVQHAQVYTLTFNRYLHIATKVLVWPLPQLRICLIQRCYSVLLYFQH